MPISMRPLRQFNSQAQAARIPSNVGKPQVRRLCSWLDAASNHHLLDLADGPRRDQSLGANVHTVQDVAATKQSKPVVEVVQSLRGGRVAAVDEKAVGLQQAGRADVFVRVPPEARTGR